MPSESHLLDKWEPDNSPRLLFASLTEAHFRCHPGTGYTGTALPTGQGPRASMAGTAQFITVTGLKQALLPALCSVYGKTTTTTLTCPLQPPLPSPAHLHPPTAPTTMARV